MKKFQIKSAHKILNCSKATNQLASTLQACCTYLTILQN